MTVPETVVEVPDEVADFVVTLFDTDVAPDVTALFAMPASLYDVVLNAEPSPDIVHVKVPEVELVADHDSDKVAAISQHPRYPNTAVTERPDTVACVKSTYDP